MEEIVLNLLIWKNLMVLQMLKQLKKFIYTFDLTSSETESGINIKLCSYFIRNLEMFCAPTLILGHKNCLFLAFFRGFLC